MTPKRQFASPYGFVFNIQRYSLHDGPGIRTIVFLKGCPLRCRWCSNPESQRLEPELGFNEGKCIGAEQCALCARECPSGAVKQSNGGRVRIDRKLCRECFTCAEVCPARALTVFGKLMTVDEVVRAVEADGVFYGRSGGGMTLSGGEPLAQAGFAIQLLAQAKRRRIDTSMETCGFAEWADLEEACLYLGSIFFDIKCIDAEKHKEFTGVSNERILENFQRLCESFPELPKYVRTPVIPGFNDSEKEIEAIADFIRGRPGVEYELLAYHRLGTPKYGYLGRDCPLNDIVPQNARVEILKQTARSRMACQVCS
ncbi:MAG: glycyl-radical enzyme activating protein [Syntrophobacteraceae bacterium]